MWSVLPPFGWARPFLIAGTGAGAAAKKLSSEDMEALKRNLAKVSFAQQEAEKKKKAAAAAGETPKKKFGFF